MRAFLAELWQEMRRELRYIMLAAFVATCVACMLIGAGAFVAWLI